MPAVYARIIGYFGDISLKMVQERLKIASPHFFENLFLEFGKSLGGQRIAEGLHAAREMYYIKDFRIVKRHDMFQKVHQLPDIARPLIIAEKFDCRR